MQMHKCSAPVSSNVFVVHHLDGNGLGGKKSSWQTKGRAVGKISLRGRESQGIHARGAVCLHHMFFHVTSSLDKARSPTVFTVR